jgi:hypothetical protein
VRSLGRFDATASTAVVISTTLATVVRVSEDHMQSQLNFSVVSEGVILAPILSGVRRGDGIGIFVGTMSVTKVE